jgi:hypothetical protein
MSNEQQQADMSKSLSSLESRFRLIFAFVCLRFMFFTVANRFLTFVSIDLLFIKGNRGLTDNHIDFKTHEIRLTIAQKFGLMSEESRK